MPEMRCLAAFSAMVFATAAMAHGNSVAVLMVSAEVKPSTVLRFEANTSAFSISAADIQRGYVEIPADAFFKLSAGKFNPVISIDSVPLERAGTTYRLKLPDKLAPLTLNVEL
jgi:hypothetical protein